MRLINTKTLKLESVTDFVVTETSYCILSHTWADDEVTFQDMQDLSIARCKAGFSKIERTCQIAVSQAIRYAWIDTCCIDKSSSAELMEAINSMFRWYKDALVCYAYLSDLPAGMKAISSDDFRDCKWFTRGWTLQELIAPSNIMFFDKYWNFRGRKKELEEEIQVVTGISRRVLTDSVLLSTISIAQRMSWASERQTTRVEDMSYCLLGIFDVNIPLIYGEGSKAFFRLQEEILKKTTDLSIFAWKAKEQSPYRTILARSPAEFLDCGDIFLAEDQFSFPGEITITNKGVKINTTLQYHETGSYIFDLHCSRKNAVGVEAHIGIYLKRALDTYFRSRPQITAPTGTFARNITGSVYLASNTDVQRISSMVNDDKSLRIYIGFPRYTYSPQYSVEDIKPVPRAYWHDNEKYFSIHGLRIFSFFVHFCVVSCIYPPGTDRGPVNEQRTNFILVGLMSGLAKLSMGIYTESDLHSGLLPDGIIDPFRDVEQYGPLGDPFSLSMLGRARRDIHELSVTHKDRRHGYVVSARLATIQSPPFRILISVRPPPGPSVDS